MTKVRIGVMYDRDWAPEGLPEFARQAEALGVDDLWVVEDLGWNGGVSAAAVALGATERIRVGIGIAPAPLRSPALLAMELATLARVFPGRLVAGIGHGVQEWMAQVGAAALSPLALLEETITSVRALLRGERVELEGREVRLDGVRLTHPPAEAPPVVAGVVRARSLELSGRAADGTVIAEGHGPQDLENARALIAKGGAESDHTLTVFAFTCVGDDADEVTRILRPHVEGHGAWLGRPPHEVFTVSGSASRAAGLIRELATAGADTVVLRMTGPDPLGQLKAVVEAAAQQN
ncbi:alkanesulfonate monooxygenase SsuD/methylene tetrahydromethanopterin reductase-like flavin-dependent oxidoreductase (luciferase family) [Streptomyces sp. SAI-208]|uniref:LLM class flavin-dependent oxidoreductase n=1 Tax=unclassified Streptomyces TaxID=2593676 RepID=UPI002473DA20|nr:MULTISPECIES: LLM class flavin-dependent oxidoreductase [unclassified Streptomyces]MDH6514375.1 alkanesulfonate monooxygenase SsuD/methylene tetrahydromethanopterin reductase-like flavin-dependent oxidoreductase (luciferase family) [Streptomyces sp. SAI-090]MDH6605217.1 alkanesulfonate monooxygenase SsuD/methylene tetrahydromethanopterin reductase-like flavin-dependent oxidoreductase (luciferase family) [Streptomyces sp. SAI-208]MDH6621542.1 alkanesulfonate monooxygenase SsuD/methylene tetrah